MESSLIGLMERHGIGTDATVAEHIQKQLDRGCALLLPSMNSVYGSKGFSSHLQLECGGCRGFPCSTRCLDLTVPIAQLEFKTPFVLVHGAYAGSW